MECRTQQQAVLRVSRTTDLFYGDGCLPCFILRGLSGDKSKDEMARKEVETFVAHWHLDKLIFDAPTSLAFDSEIQIGERIISLELPWDMCTTSLRTGT